MRDTSEDLLDEVREQLERLGAVDASVRLNREFEPEAGPLIELKAGGAEWHLAPRELLELLRGLANGCGPERIKATIESASIAVWHGPAPRSRDT